MADKNSPAHEPADRALVITRIFDAPRDLVFKAWTEPERLMRWWGPKGFTLPVCEIDLRPGGTWLYCMRSPEGHEYWGKGVYREIVEPERIVYTHSFADEQGNPVPASHYGMSSDWPIETLVTLTITEHEGKTKLTLHAGIIPSGTSRDMAEAGWNSSLDCLADYLTTA